MAELLNGQSGCVLVYGQTGSGKTFTMFGEAEARYRGDIGEIYLGEVEADPRP